MNGPHSPLTVSSGHQRQKVLQERNLLCLAGSPPPLLCGENNKDNSAYFLFLGIEEHQPALVQQYMHGPQQSSMQDSWTGTGSVLRPHHAPKGGVWYRLEHPANPSISASCVYTPALDASDLVTQLASIFKGCCRQTF